MEKSTAMAAATAAGGLTYFYLNRSTAVSTEGKHGEQDQEGNGDEGGVWIDWSKITDSHLFALYYRAANRLQGLYGAPLVACDPSGEKMVHPNPTPKVWAPVPARLEECESLKPVKIRGVKFRNRVIRAAAFDGESVDEICKTHGDVVKGGVGLTVLAYCSVSVAGKTFDTQTVVDGNAAAITKLTAVTEHVHSLGGKIACQLTHAGAYADRKVTNEHQLSPSGVFNHSGFDFPKAATNEDIALLLDQFETSARVAMECGFDVIELHCGHGYLLSQWMSSLTNRRQDRYGGSAENRARFPIECLKRVRKAVGEDVPILVKMNMHDGFPGGLKIHDSLIMANLFAEASADILVLTAGQVFMNGIYMIRGPVPMRKLVQGMPGNLKRFALALFGSLAVPEIPYESCFLRTPAREVLKTVKERHPHTSVCLMGGIDSFGAMEGAMNEGFDFVQIARALIREPDFLQRIAREVRQREEQLFGHDYRLSNRLTEQPQPEPQPQSQPQQYVERHTMTSEQTGPSFEKVRALKTASSSSSSSTTTDAGSPREGIDDAWDVESKCIRCNLCVVSTIDPKAPFGCPFQKMEEKRKLQMASSGSSTVTSSGSSTTTTSSSSSSSSNASAVMDMLPHNLSESDLSGKSVQVQNSGNARLTISKAQAREMLPDIEDAAKDSRL